MTAQLAKIRFELDPTDWHGHGSELLWALPMESAADAFLIRNSPFFTTGISHCDVVKAKVTEHLPIYQFENVLQRGGHSTYMLLVEEKSPTFPFYWKFLEDKGCSYESMSIDLSMGRRMLLSVDVPPSTNLPEIYEVFKRGEGDNTWMFQEGFASLQDRK